MHEPGEESNAGTLCANAAVAPATPNLCMGLNADFAVDAAASHAQQITKKPPTRMKRGGKKVQRAIANSKGAAV